jgi:acetyl-CoA C-acetyltransferase
MVPVEISKKRKETTVVEEDFGVFPTTREGLAKLKPVAPYGVVTYGSQTHPADGTAGMVVTSEQHARELSPDGGVVRLLGLGFARVEKARMPKAPVPAARSALADAGLKIEEVDAIKTHNPFAVNDVYVPRQTGRASSSATHRGGRERGSSRCLSRCAGVAGTASGFSPAAHRRYRSGASTAGRRLGRDFGD